MRIYDHDLGVRTATELPAVASEGPPPGVHMPGPSFRPFLGAVGTGMLMLGLVFGGWLLAAGVIALVATLVGWLIDAREEYVKTVEADTTGHLENMPAAADPGAAARRAGRAADRRRRAPGRLAAAARRERRRGAPRPVRRRGAGEPGLR